MINLCTLFHDDLGDVPLGVFEAVVTGYNPKTQKWIVKYDFDNELEAFDSEDLTHFVIDAWTTPIDWKGTDKAQKRLDDHNLPTIDVNVDAMQVHDSKFYVNKPLQACIMNWVDDTEKSKQWALELYGPNYATKLIYGWVERVRSSRGVKGGSITFDTRWSDNTSYAMCLAFVHKAYTDYANAPKSLFNTVPDSISSEDEDPISSPVPQLSTIKASSAIVQRAHFETLDTLDDIEEEAQRLADIDEDEIAEVGDDSEEDDESTEEEVDSSSEDDDEDDDEDSSSEEDDTFDKNILGNKEVGTNGKLQPIKRNPVYTKEEKKVLIAELDDGLAAKLFNKTFVKHRKKRIQKDIEEPSIEHTRWRQGKVLEHPPPKEVNDKLATREFDVGYLKGLSVGVDAKDMNYAELFVHFLPADGVRTLCKHTQAKIRDMQSREYPKSTRAPFLSKFVFDEAQFYKFIACLMYMQGYPQSNRATYWADDVLGPLFEGIMPFADFDIIARGLTLVDPNNLDKSDPFNEIRSWIDGMNTHFKLAYEAGSLLTGDESMSKQTQVGVPGYKVIIRKPNSRGHEFHTCADALSKILMHAELYEGKEAEKKKKYGVDEGKFQAHTGTVLRMVDWAAFSDKTIVLDAGFGSVATIKALQDLGIYAIANVKGCHMQFCKQWMLSQLKSRGDVAFATATFVNPSTGAKHSVLASGHCDRAPMCLISSVCRGDPGKSIQRTRYYMDKMLQMKKFVWTVDQPDTHAIYRDYFNVIDLINRGREAGTALHDIWCPQDWIKRLFSTTIGFVEGNALNAHEQLHPIATSRTGGDTQTPTTCLERVATTFAARRKVLAKELLLFANSLQSSQAASTIVVTTPRDCFHLFSEHPLTSINSLASEPEPELRRRLKCQFCGARVPTCCKTCKITCCSPFNTQRKGTNRSCLAMHLKEVQTGRQAKTRKIIPLHNKMSPATKTRVVNKRKATLERRRSLIGNEFQE